jgi:hypothetical protein
MTTDYTKKDKEPGEEETPREKLKPVVTAEVVIKEPSLGRKMKSIFFGGEFKSASRYVVTDVILPAFRDTVFDVMTAGTERVIYGESRTPRRRHRGMTTGALGSITNYNRPIQRGARSAMLPDQPPRGMNRVTRRESNDVLIADREEAVLVLDTLNECITRYEVASLADLNELLNQPSAVVDQKWGWFSLSDANIRQTRQGYLLELPPLEEI